MSPPIFPAHISHTRAYPWQHHESSLSSRITKFSADPRIKVLAKNPMIITSPSYFQSGFFKKWAIPGLFFFIFRLFYNQLTVSKCSIKVADDWIQTRVLWYWKGPLCQLCHNHCPLSIAVASL